jgi:hypothetical protein
MFFDDLMYPAWLENPSKETIGHGWTHCLACVAERAERYGSSPMRLLTRTIVSICSWVSLDRRFRRTDSA